MGEKLMAKLKAQAEAHDMTTSEYMRALVVADLRKGEGK